MTPDHPLQRRVLQTIQRERLLVGSDSILAAVSGGPDSVALLHLLVTLRECCGISRLAVLHFDHQLRGAASTADQAFVANLASAFGLPFHTASADVRAYRQQHRLSLEMAARACRHRFFREALTRFNANAVALGHTANDQAEEILLRLCRGTGPAGMAGMLPKTAEHLIRPLLGTTRREILAYLQDHRLEFREDSSNLDPTHQRNVLRHEILPLLEKHFHPRLIEVLGRHARLAQGEESFWTGLSASQWPVVCDDETPSRIALDRQRLLDQHPAVLRRLLRLAVERLRGHLQAIYCGHLEALCRLLVHGSPGRSLQLPRGLRATLEGPLLILSNHPEKASCPFTQVFEPPMDGPGTYEFPSLGLSLTIEAQPGPADAHAFPESGHTARLDADTIVWPLFLRTWEKGDRFRPLGLGGRKKLQDLFVDLKIPRGERRRVPLLCDQEKICWVLDFRLDDRVKITPQTRRVIEIRKADPG